MQGGSIPLAYMNFIMRREGQLAPLTADQLTVGDQLDIIACIQGEKRAEAAQRQLQQPLGGN